MIIFIVWNLVLVGHYQKKYFSTCNRSRPLQDYNDYDRLQTDYRPTTSRLLRSSGEATSQRLMQTAPTLQNSLGEAEELPGCHQRSAGHLFGTRRGSGSEARLLGRYKLPHSVLP